MVTKGLNKITQNETQDLQLVDNFCKSWEIRYASATGSSINSLILLSGTFSSKCTG